MGRVNRCRALSEGGWMAIYSPSVWPRSVEIPWPQAWVQSPGASSRNRLRSTFPAALRGSSDTNTNDLGNL